MHHTAPPKRRMAGGHTGSCAVTSMTKKRQVCVATLSLRLQLAVRSARIAALIRYSLQVTMGGFEIGVRAKLKWGVVSADTLLTASHASRHFVHTAGKRVRFA